MTIGTDSAVHQDVLDRHCFPLVEYERRLSLVRAEMGRQGIDVLLVMQPEDQFYLTGYRSLGFAAWQALIVTVDRDPLMVSRVLEESGYRHTSVYQEYRPYRDDEEPVTATVGALRGLGVRLTTVGVPTQSRYLTVAGMEGMRAQLPETRWADTTNLVTNIRIVKSDLEIRKIKTAATLTSAGIRAAISEARAGATENDLGAAFMDVVVRGGSEPPAHAPYIATGVRSAFAHPAWEGNVLKPGDVVFFEGGACINRYHAGLMRSISVGEPSASTKHLEQASLAGVQAAIEALRPGATSGAVDAACRDAVAEAGAGEYFRNRAGYSIGIGFTTWADGFSLRPGDETVLQENMVVHIVPFISSGQEAVAISETVHITADGAHRLLDVEQQLFTV